jgi:hypothetical protein
LFLLLLLCLLFQLLLLLLLLNKAVGPVLTISRILNKNQESVITNLAERREGTSKIMLDLLKNIPSYSLKI